MISVYSHTDENKDYLHLSVFARIERGQGADLGKGHFCARPITLRALLRVILQFEGTMGK